MTKTEKSTIAELEALIEKKGQENVSILPSGEVIVTEATPSELADWIVQCKSDSDSMYADELDGHRDDKQAASLWRQHGSDLILKIEQQATKLWRLEKCASIDSRWMQWAEARNAELEKEIERLQQLHIAETNDRK